MGASRRARSAAPLIAVLAMVGFALPPMVWAGIALPPSATPPGVQAKPTDLPTPKPKPTATPVATPTPVPTAAPSSPASQPPGPTLAPAPTAVTPGPTAAPTAGPLATGSPATAAPGGGVPTGASSPAPGGTGQPSPLPGESGDAGGILLPGPGGGSASTSPTSSFDGWLTSVGAPIGYLALVLVVAFVIGRRRLERSQRAAAPQAVLAGRGAGPVRDPDSLPVARFASRTQPESRPAVADDEADTPRWLRPSLRAERFGADLAPARSSERALPLGLRIAGPPARTPLAFGGAPADLDDRRLVRHDGVALLDRPDEAGGRRLSQLERGDEVAVLEREAGWVNVLTPTGEAGWLPEAVLATSGAAQERSRATPDRHAMASGAAASSVAGSRITASPAAAPPDEPLDLAALLAAGHRGGPEPDATTRPAGRQPPAAAPEA
ncbi:MAG: hypothetical protein EPO36_05270 [Chloroflexota bacterium]|nr:MAG: hypothetical protein EPO36_05270 [Chloroflexota bacterium]